MLRLDPAYPPVWRSPTTLQFGLDPVAVIEDPRPWQQRLLRELEQGIAEAALEPIAVALGAPDRAAHTFVLSIAGALRHTPHPRRTVTLQLPDPFSPAHAEAVAHGLRSTGLEVRLETWFGAQSEVRRSDEVSVVLAHHVIEPRRVGPLMAADVPHLPVVFTGVGAQVGPLVVPGATACLVCISEHRRDDDTAWPSVAAQLLGRTAPEVRESLALEAGIAAARLLSEGVDHRAPRPATPWQSAPLPQTHSLLIRADSLHRSIHAHQPHEACRCRSLAENATAVDHGSLVTMTATAYARPA